MVIGIDISPLINSSQHKVRGVGRYIKLLKDNIEKFDTDNKYHFFDKEIPVSANIIHYPYFDPYFINIPLSLRKPIIVTVHDLITVKHKKNFPPGLWGAINWRINKMNLKKAKRIIVDSDASGKDLMEIVGMSNDKVKTVYLACEEIFKPNKSKDQFIKISKKFNLPSKFFLYVGDVTWNKNLPRILDAVEKAKIPIVLVGKALAEESFDRKNPWNSDRIKVLQKTQNNKLFIKLGFVSNEELNILYNNAICLCMPSIDEGFGLPVLEAIKAGCPVITSNSGSLPEVAGESALYVDHLDTSSIYEGLVRLDGNSSLRGKLIEMGIEQASRFTLKKMMEDTISVYNNL